MLFHKQGNSDVEGYCGGVDSQIRCKSIKIFVERYALLNEAKVYKFRLIFMFFIYFEHSI